MKGNIMCENTPVAEFSGNEVRPLLPALVPLCFRNGGDLERWLCARAVDRHRTNSRILKKLLRMGDTSDFNTALRSHGATVTDGFWVRTQEESALRWEDVRFSTDYFADAALRGLFSDFSVSVEKEKRSTPTPELTNIGSYEKCWRLLGGKWVMLKSSTPQERYSEIFTAALGEKLGFRMAHYYEREGYTATDNFVPEGVNFEPMWNISGENEDYGDVYEELKALAPGLPEQYLAILYLDALVFNVDRHTQNFGVLRDRNTGAVLGMAPNFDNNMALISRGYAEKPENTSHLLTDMFLDLLRDKRIAYERPKLGFEELEELAVSVMPGENIDRDYVTRFVWMNYERLSEI